ncbi:TRAM/LAG1/CLN8 homology domain [uncultured virus]|nr:TRAM/LAG1/CLN8 homology domain [uncultured virus]
MEKVVFVQLAYYLSATLFSLFPQQLGAVVRKDHYVMLAHHVVTAALLGISIYGNQIGTGLVTLFFHDIADPFLEFGKVCNYRGYEVLKTVSFVCFTVTFAIFRLYMLPRYIVLPCVLGTSCEALPFVPTLFVALQLMHCYWFGLVLKMAYRLLFTSSLGEDDRSDDDDD